MSEKHDHGAERVRRHFEKPQTELHKGGRSAGQRALIAGAVVAAGVLTAPIWAPVVVTAAYVTVVALTVTAAVAVATAPVWAPIAVIGWAAHKAFKAGKSNDNTAPSAAPRKPHVAQAPRHDARRVTDNAPPRGDRRHIVKLQDPAPAIARPRRNRKLALPRP